MKFGVMTHFEPGLATVKFLTLKNPRWRTADIVKPLNRHIPATIRRIAMKFGMTTHFDPL